MPTVTGPVEVTWTRSPGPPPTVAVSRIRVVGGRSGDGILDLIGEGIPAEWLAVLVSLAGKRAAVTYEVGPPLVVSEVKSVA